ncbi:type II toxin-antitoxin system PemK/MazF family toxin [Tardiphaga sp.]|uniref:type II toxin-antitoxin system PemK/MazF family toxin n=1 Tax=Tardiphaga sp. TaxID=1926292 RepID=UPI002628F087|nr:type II toxin-antitoxin system PemK/MazF family toxin [Tardiphaga sp.]MDB5618871.1 transcriptional modulator of MazE/toxin, MazF [Tardiphaga sp.]
MMLPDVGDIAWVDLDDTRGTEQSGRRPAIVLTSLSFHETSRRAIICPITSKFRDWPTNVALPHGLTTVGMILVDQVRSIDRAERMFDTIEKAPVAVVDEVRNRLAALLGIDFNSIPGGAGNA